MKNPRPCASREVVASMAEELACHRSNHRGSEVFRGETGRDKVLLSFQQGRTANAGFPVFLLSHQGDRSPANCRLLAPL